MQSPPSLERAAGRPHSECGSCGPQQAETKARDISEEGIRQLVDSFYDKVRADAVLGPIFDRALGGEWDPHLAKMRDFWSSVMLTSGRYHGNPVLAHLRTKGIEPQMFVRWLALFGETCGELFAENVAEAFQLKAGRIAESLKLAMFYRPDRHWNGTAP